LTLYLYTRATFRQKSSEHHCDLEIHHEIVNCLVKGKLRKVMWALIVTLKHSVQVKVSLDFARSYVRD